MTDEKNGSIDALLPRDMAAKAERIGAEKTRLDAPRLLVLGILPAPSSVSTRCWPRS